MISPKLLTEYQNITAFYVVTFVLGILGGLAGVPVPAIGWIIGVGVCILCLLKHQLRRIGILILCLGLGYGAALYRVQTIQTTILSEPVYDVDVSGVVVNHTLTGVDLNQVRFHNNSVVVPPEKIRLKSVEQYPNLAVGSVVRAVVFLRPTMTPVDTLAYNERRNLWFDGIGAVGRIKKLLTVSPPKEQTVKLFLDKGRTIIQNRIKSVLPAETAEVVIPLVVGDQSGVSEHLYDIFRSSGLIHVLSVSGFHLSLLGVFVFFLIRSVLGACPFLSVRFSGKKIAAVLTMVFAAAYVGLSGMQIPAVRAWIMLCVVMTAILFNRNALSVRSWTVAVFGILLFRPELILNIGFQLSFVAVLVLVTLCQPLAQVLFPDKPMSFVRKFGVWVVSVIVVDLLINLATIPFVIYHFNQVPVYGCIGNILTGVVLSFWVMPCLFLACLLMPLGGDVLFWKASGLGLNYILSVCETIHNMPNAVMIFPSFSSVALIVMGMGILFLCLMKTKWRFVGVGIVMVGGLLAIWTPRPDVLVGDSGRTIAVRQENGQLAFVRRGPNDYIAKMWLLHNGQSPDFIPELTETGPVLYVKGKKISLTYQDCPGADICFVADKEGRGMAYPLYVFETRALFVREKDVVVKTAEFDFP